MPDTMIDCQDCGLPFDGRNSHAECHTEYPDEDQPVGECAKCHKLVYPDWVDMPLCENCGAPLAIIPSD